MAAQPVKDVAEAITEAVKHFGPQPSFATAKTPVRETRGLAAPSLTSGVGRSLPSEAQPKT
jgi:hypothetical protein